MKKYISIVFIAFFFFSPVAITVPDNITDEKTGIVYKQNNFGDICLELEGSEKAEKIKTFVQENLKKYPRKAFVATLKIEKAGLIPSLVEAGFEHHFTNTLKTEWIIRNDSSVPYPFTGISGTLVVTVDKDNNVLLVEDTIRPNQWGFPGGMLLPREFPMAAAARELGEEVALATEEKNLHLIGNIERKKSNRYGASESTKVYLTKEYTGDVRPQEEEIKTTQWAPLDKVVSEGEFKGIPLDEYNKQILAHVYNQRKEQKRFEVPDPRQFYKKAEDRDPTDLMILELF